MSDLREVEARMRADWNERAREDANYYVAFGRRNQDLAEFLDTGSDTVRALLKDTRYLGPGLWRAQRALEIGCGPGRLMLPLAARFGEIHGVDVSDEMIARARETLRGVRHAHAHVGSGSRLDAFANESFDFVYSYAVFQHIPSQEVIWSYLREARRVLKHGGVLRVQVNGLEKRPGETTNTWSGASFTRAMLLEFAREQDLRILSAEGEGTQYLWTTMIRKEAKDPTGPAAIRRVTNADSSEPCAPAAGRFAAASLWVDSLPEAADLNTLEVRFRGAAGIVTYIGPPERDGLTQVNALLPGGLRPGLCPVELFWKDGLLSAPAHFRVLPAPPFVAHVRSVSDGVDLLNGTVVRSGSVKVMVDETASVDGFEATVDGTPVTGVETFLPIPRIPRWEINFRLPDGCGAGKRLLEMKIPGRKFAPVVIEVANR